MSTKVLSRWLFCFAAFVSCFSPLSATATDHAVVVVAASPNELKELATHLPQVVQSQIVALGARLAGPLFQVAAKDQPVGLWMDWHGDLPRPVLFMSKPNREALQSALQTLQVVPKDLGGGIFEIALTSTVYYREHEGWLFFSPTQEDLKTLQDPLTLVEGFPKKTINAKANLRMIPQGSRTEIAKVIATRLLPMPVAGPNEVTPENVAVMYGKRFLQSISQQGDVLGIGIGNDEGHLTIDFDIYGDRLARVNRASACSLIPQVTGERNALRFHTVLQDEEVAFLSWWAQSLPERVIADFERADIADRSGKIGLVELSRLASQLISKTVLQGSLEGYASLVGPEADTPYLVIQTNSTKWLDQEMRRFANSGYAVDLQIGGVELDLEESNGVKLHRFTIAPPGEEPLSIIAAVGSDGFALTVGQTGLETLREHLSNSTGNKLPPAPLDLHVSNYGLETLFGWSSDKEQNKSSAVTVSSDYTEKGVHYRVRFSE